MMHLLAAVLLLLVTVGWFALALLPALREHFGRRDIAPLRLSSEAANIRFFAHSFRRHVDSRLPRLRAAAKGTRTFVMPLDRDIVWYASPAPEPTTVFAGDDELPSLEKLTVMAESDLAVPDDTVVSRELFCGGSLDAGARTAFRALLVEGNASLGEQATVVRWADAGGALQVGPNSTLWGRASSGGPMSLAEGTTFERLGAPRIVFGSDPDEPFEPATDIDRVRLEPPNGAIVAEGRWAIDGDYDVPAGALLPASLVVSGALRVGRGCRIDGAVRANTVALADACELARSIVAEESLSVGARCSIVGPVAVEGLASFGDGCRIGSPGDETTISATGVRMARGVVLCGEVWARSGGQVISQPAGPVTKAQQYG